MTLRTQLVVAFLLLALMPLFGIVLYSYTSSIGSFRRAVASETEAMTAELDQRMRSIRAEMDSLVEELGQVVVPLVEAAGSSESTFQRPGSDDRAFGEAYSQLVAGVGAAADLVEWFELSPLSTEGDQEATIASTPIDSDPLIIFPSQALANAFERRERFRDRDPESRQALETALAPILSSAIRRRSELDQGELAALEASAAQSRRVFGFGFRSPVSSDGQTLGYLEVHVRPLPMLRQVLGRTEDPDSQMAGTVPYAIGADGNLYTAEPADRELLTTLLRGREVGGGRPTLTGMHPDWIAVETDSAAPRPRIDREPVSSLVFGIARPIRESLSDMRQTAARNFFAGLVIGALALAGVLWFSSRMTRRLDALTHGAERLAEGDWQVRVPAQSKDELGQLARTFNRMALQLSKNEQRLLEEERRRKDQEMQQRLLQAENQRKSQELEEARRFQLSLLPQRLPILPSVDIAVHMRTATEVGGDYYDFFADGNGGLVAAVGDATGHGSRAGTMATVIKGMLSLGMVDDLTAFLDQANQAIRAMRLERMKMSLTLLQIEGRRIQIAAAGMPPALLHRAAAGKVEEIALEGSPLGGIASFEYDQWSGDLAPGDTLVVMSDGFPELLDPKGEQLGYVRARDVFERAAHRPPSEIIAELNRAANEWNGHSAPNDDVTFVVFQARSGNPAAAGRQDVVS